MDDLHPRRAWHPLTAAFVATLLAQVAGLFAHYFGTDDGGHRVFSSPLNMLMIAVPLYVSWWFLIAAAFAVLWMAVPRLRAAVTATWLALAFALLWLVPADFAMQHFRGERLTLAQMRDYGLSALFNSDVAGPVLRHPWYPAVTLGIPLAALLLFAWLWRAARGRLAHPPSWRGAGASVVIAAACYAPTMFAYYHQRDMAQPPEVDWALQLLPRAPAPAPAQEAASRSELRGFLDPRGTATWLSDSFPLIRSGGGAGAAPVVERSDLPDIVVFVVESLRGRDVGYGLYPPAPGASPTPRLDALARESVVFPRYIANGEPTPRGFITINTGVWEHRSGFITADFPNLQLDALPNRLRKHGYHTIALWGANPSFDNELAWARRWYDEVDFELPGNGLFYFHTRPDTLVMDHLLQRLRAHDAAAPEQPVFAYVSTNGTHTPYQPE
ncbi:MAG: sulfatase-like hydrolase/transferase, partial [Gemmatimonadetes bacterium]|nr:sulfatase-like hydrolase/transferase [Gemmatimonadota bacterium]